MCCEYANGVAQPYAAKTEAEVIGCGPCQIDASVETLVTNEHARKETARRKFFGSLQTAMAKESTFIVDEVGLAIDDSRQPRGVVATQLLGDIVQDTLTMELIACIQEDYIVAFRLSNRFVHRIIEAVVGLTDEYDIVRMTLVGVALNIALDLYHRAVGGTTVNDEMFYGFIGLRIDALERAADGGSGVISDSGDGEANHRT